MENAFYQQTGPDTYLATSATIGPWSADAQHGGPPSALAARAIELHEPDPRQRLARVSVDILRPVPVGEISVRARTVRPGRRVALIESVLESGGQEVLHARGWRIERPSGDVPVVRDLESDGGAQWTGGQVPPAGDGLTPPIFEHAPLGYLSMIEWRFMAAGGGKAPEHGTTSEFARPAVKEDETGLTAQLSTVWTRPRLPLIAGEDTSPMTRALLVADCGSGIGAALPATGFIFINVDLSVVLTRDPITDWLLLEASTAIGPDGTGLATTRLSDEQGSFGRAFQTLLVAPRP